MPRERIDSEENLMSSVNSGNQNSKTSETTGFNDMRPEADSAMKLQEMIKNKSPENLSQQIETKGNVVPLYADAWEIMNTEFKPSIMKLGAQVGGEAQVAPLKGLTRSKEKAKTEMGGDSAKLLDIIRGSIICEKPSQLVEAFETTSKLFDIVRVKNRFANPADGYRDLLLNIRLSNGHVAELQLHLRHIINAKEKGHKDYEVARVLEAKKDRTDEENQELALRKADMQGLYDDAWSKVLEL